MLVLLVKLTALFTAATIALFAARNATAAMRHLLCLCALLGSLLLPFGLLVPERTMALRTSLLSVAAFSAPGTAHASASYWASLAAWCWACGTALLLARLGYGYWRVSRLLQTAKSIHAGHLTADVTVPMAAGLFRPVVLAPRDFAEWPEERRAAAERHEFAHIGRKDLWANLAANLACALYWFHPLAWVLASRMRHEQEAACDDAVLSSGFDPATYAEALLAVAKDFRIAPIPGCSMATRSGLKSRIARLFEKKAARRTSRLALFSATVGFAVILSAVVALRPVRAQQVYTAGGDVVGPKVLFKIEPPYTEEARRDKLEGPVILAFVVGTDGLAHNIAVTQGLGDGLTGSAAEALEKWHFTPGTLNGNPVPVRAVVEVNFRLM